MMWMKGCFADCLQKCKKGAALYYNVSLFLNILIYLECQGGVDGCDSSYKVGETPHRRAEEQIDPLHSSN